MPTVEMYCTAACRYCSRARRLLDRKGVSYIELRIDLEPHLREDMEARSGRTTVPQIFIDDVCVGGFDELSLMDMEGELDKLLRQES
jgi:glutaredoxin 3